jgi:hypothetical protein
MTHTSGSSSTGDITITLSDSTTTSTIDLSSIYTSDSIYIDTSTLGVDYNTKYVDLNEVDDRLAKVEKIIAEEAELRAKHPTLKEAYDHYKFLLELAKDHGNNLLTDE